MEGSKLFVIFLLSTDAENFKRDDKRGERHAYLVRNSAKRLSSAILDSFMVSKPMGCVFRCISQLKCYSVNFAAVSHDGRYMCELLNVDKFQNSSMSSAIDALKRLGATDPVQLNDRGSFALAGYAGVNKPQWNTQKRANSGQGPSEIFPQIAPSVSQ